MITSIRFRFLLCSVLVLMAVSVHAQGFRFSDFRENPTDMTAATSGVKDLNGRAAALIRFVVRAPQFEFDANMGIIKTEKHTGEVWVYVPHGTKRLTVRHPYLGVVRDFEPPVAIKSKTTYDVELVILDRAYMESLYQQQQNGDDRPIETDFYAEPQTERPPVQQQERQPEREPDQIRYQSDISDPVYYPAYPSQDQPVSHKSTVGPVAHFYAGIGFNAVSLMGPSVSLGLNFKGFMVEGGFVYGMDKVENVTFTLRNSSKTSESYDYSCMKALARVGYQIEAVEHFFITPLAGATFNMISGKSTLNSTSTDYFKESNPMSIHAAIRFSYEVIDHLRVHLTPQYDFSIGGDEIFEVIKQGDSKIKTWGEGFGINVGVIYEF